MFLAVSCRRRFFFFFQLYTLLTICTTQFQTHLIQNHKTALSNQIPPHLLDPLWQNWTFGCQWFFIHPLGLSVVLGTQKKQAATGGEGWGELLRGSWTIDYCQWRGSRTRKLSKRRKENQEKQQLRAWDDLDCSSTPPPLFPSPKILYGNTLEEKQASVARCCAHHRWTEETKLLQHLPNASLFSARSVSLCRSVSVSSIFLFVRWGVSPCSRWKKTLTMWRFLFILFILKICQLANSPALFFCLFFFTHFNGTLSGTHAGLPSI